MIIDVHSHNFPDRIAVKVMAALTKAAHGVLTPYGDGTLDDHLNQMERFGIDKACLLQIATKPEQFDILMENAKAIRDGAFGERAKEKIIPFLSVHPSDEKLMEHLEAVANEGFKGVKLHPYYQNFSLKNRDILPMFKKIAELGLVVQCHCGNDVGYVDEPCECGPNEIAYVLKNVKNLIFIAAHLGGCDGFPSHATDEISDLGAYIDTSALAHNWNRDEEMRIVSQWPKDRIMFATDFPWNSYPDTIAWVKSCRASSDWDAIFSENAKRIFAL